MESGEITTELDYSQTDIDSDLQKAFDPEAERDVFVKLTRMALDVDTSEDEPEYSVISSTTKITWKLSVDAYKNYIEIGTPVIVKASGIITVEKITGPKDDWTEEQFEKDWETDSDWTLEVKSWGSTNLDQYIEPNYVVIDLDSKKLYVDF